MTDKKKTPSGGNREGAKQYRHHHLTNSRPFLQDMVAAFKTALDRSGLVTKDKITADGRLYRFTVQGDRPGSKNGWYVLFDGPVPAGAFGSWKTGVKGTWCAKGENTLTKAEREDFKRRMNEARKAREAEEEARHTAARERASKVWDTSLPASDNHPYLVKKGVRNHGLRLFKEQLLVPLRDVTGTLHSLQFIDGGGNKLFLSGGRVAGCFYLIGTPMERICICEGYATGASIYEATGHAVAVAFNCGNLLPVAQVMRQKFTATELVMCADNDTQTPGNPGLTKAREAATSVGAFLAIPPCHGDFNDLLNVGVR
jgi:putative DNA primase/helicase